jgi:hypothetical protein
MILKAVFPKTTELARPLMPNLSYALVLAILGCCYFSTTQSLTSGSFRGRLISRPLFGKSQMQPTINSDVPYLADYMKTLETKLPGIVQEIDNASFPSEFKFLKDTLKVSLEPLLLVGSFEAALNILSITRILKREIGQDIVPLSDYLSKELSLIEFNEKEITSIVKINVIDDSFPLDYDLGNVRVRLYEYLDIKDLLKKNKFVKKFSSEYKKEINLLMGQYIRSVLQKALDGGIFFAGRDLVEAEKDSATNGILVQCLRAYLTNDETAQLISIDSEQLKKIKRSIENTRRTEQSLTNKIDDQEPEDIIEGDLKPDDTDAVRAMKIEKVMRMRYEKSRKSIEEKLFVTLLESLIELKK